MAPARLSPFAPAQYPHLPAIAGVRLATAEAGIRYRGRRDLLLAVFEPTARVAGVFTRSRCAAAPVDWCRSVIAAGQARALVVNSGNANAFTGMKGRAAAEATAQAAAQAVGCRPEAVLLASTGVIGEPLDPAPFAKHLAGMAGRAAADGYLDAAKAIMTTDTFAKVATRRARIGGKDVTINGIAKGSGMIAPDMATMLAFIFTDANIGLERLQKALKKAVRDSFNAITVDGDTSTSDTVLLFATGAAQARDAAQATEPGKRALAGFQAALNDLCRDLAQQIVKDGEGASKFAEINVTGAISAASAKKIALSVANSPLVKTALAGEDANWGRVVMAVGKAGEPADRDRISIHFGPHRVAFEGERDAAYSEAAVSTYMKQANIVIGIDLGLKSGRATVWTCDLTRGYVAINADYRS